MATSHYSLRIAVDEFVNDLNSKYGMHRTIAAMHKLCAAAESAVGAGESETSIKATLAPAYNYHGRSPFVRRLQTWPRGYQGDFETVEWIANPLPKLSMDDPAYWIEWYALNSAIAQQHRNKLRWQRNLVADSIRRNGNVKVLNVGCGGVAEFNDAPSFLANADFTVLDMDPDALLLAGERLKAARSVTMIQQDVIEGVRDALQKGPFDVIVCGGLFDYLPDRLISRMLKYFVAALNEGGCVGFTNIEKGNPYRVWMENLANWSLIHRGSDNIARLVKHAGLESTRLTVQRDQSGLTLLCMLRR